MDTFISNTVFSEDGAVVVLTKDQWLSIVDTLRGGVKAPPLPPKPKIVKPVPPVADEPKPGLLSLKPKPSLPTQLLPKPKLPRVTPPIVPKPKIVENKPVSDDIQAPICDFRQRNSVVYDVDIQEFIDTVCMHAPGNKIESVDLRRCYNKWANDNMPANFFGRKMCNQYRKSKYNKYPDIDIRPEYRYLLYKE